MIDILSYVFGILSIIGAVALIWMWVREAPPAEIKLQIGAVTGFSMIVGVLLLAQAVFS